MYHYQLHPPTQICRHLTSPCQHHLEHVPLLSTFRDRSSTKPPLEREAGQPLEQCKTYMMPWQTCLVCPRYPFPSLLLLDPPALWQPSPPVNCTAMSRATPLQYHRSLLPDHTHQNQRQAPSKWPITWDLKDPVHPLHRWGMQHAYKEHIEQAGYDYPVPCSPSVKSGSQPALPVLPQETSPHQSTSPYSETTGLRSSGLESIPEEDIEEAAPLGGHHQPPTMPGGIHQDPWCHQLSCSCYLWLHLSYFCYQWLTVLYLAISYLWAIFSYRPSCI